MNSRMISFYMSIAKRCSDMSRAERLHVGAVVVKNNNIISFSWNGTPSGWDNTCEEIEYTDNEPNPQDTSGWQYDDGPQRWYRLRTKPEVLHAERNALDKLARGDRGGEGASLFVTHSPCLECAKSIYGAGIKEVFFQENYRDDQGIDFLKKCGVSVTKVK